MKQFFITFFAVLSALLTLVIVLPVAGLIMTTAPRFDVPADMVLTLELNRQLLEGPASDPLSGLFGDQALSVPEIVSALKRAATDDRVKGLTLNLGGGGPRIAQVQEIRGAISKLRESGKFVQTYAQHFAGRGISAYYLAAASDEIWLQTTSELHATGISVATPFVKETLRKIGVVPQFGRRHEYKTAANSFSHDDFTRPHRESIENLLRSTFDAVAIDIARDRNMEVQQFKDIVDIGPLSAEDALSKGLVDRLGYKDEFEAALKEKTGKDTRFLTVKNYLKHVGGGYDTGDTIAVIYGAGAIVSGKSEDRGRAFSRGSTMGSDTIAHAIQNAAKDSDVKAIVFRISSPGGSYLASDQIWRAVIKAREAGKPVVASMGSVAASGGYFVAMAADRILALPGTITGSIGVMGGKMVTAGLLEKLGVRVGEISVGEYALLQSSQREYTPEQWRWVNASLDRVYDDFVGKVAQARSMTAEQIDLVARGRIWSGKSAHEIGLVDELGGFSAAIDSAKILAGISPSAPVKLKQFPPAKSFPERLLELMHNLDNVEEVAVHLNSIVEWTQALDTFSAVSQLEAASGPSVALVMPPIIELP